MRTPRFRPALAAATATVLALAAAGVAAEPEPNEKYTLNCVACHGADLRGVEGLGVSLVGSPFVAGTATPALVEFLKAGRMPDDPASVSGRPMLGFAWIPEAELVEIAEYVKRQNGG